MQLRKIMALAMLALMAFPSIGIALAAPLTVETDSESYEPGEKVEISGIADANANVTILIVFNSTTIYTNVTEADEDGEFYTEFQLSEDASEGLYNVTASSDGVEAKTHFTVIPLDESDPSSGENGDEGSDGGKGKDTTERAIGLNNSIERAFIFLDKVNDTVSKLEERGYIVKDIEANLTDAKKHLDMSRELLKALDINGTAHELAKARGILGRTMGWLHRTAEKVKETKVKTFIQNVEGQINGLEAKINRLQERLEKGMIVLSALQAKRRQLIRIRERLTAGDVDGAVDDLDKMISVIDEELKNLNGESTSVKLKAMNRIEAKIRVLNATAQRLSGRGENTSKIEEELADAKALLNRSMDLLDSGDAEGAEGLLEEAEEHLEEASDMIRVMTHPNKTGGRPDGNGGKKGGSEP